MFVDGATVIELVVPRPPFHVNVPFPPEAIRVVLFPAQIVPLPEMNIVGNEFIITSIWALVLSQPFIVWLTK